MTGNHPWESIGLPRVMHIVNFPTLLLCLALMAQSACVRRGPLTTALSPDERVEAAVASYCARQGLARRNLEEVKLDLVPDTRVFRHVLPRSRSEPHLVEARDRYAVLMVDTTTAELHEVRLLDKYSLGPTSPYKALFEAMKANGRKVTNEKEASTVVTELLKLDAWLHSTGVEYAYQKSGRIPVHRQYRRVPNSYGTVCFWSTGDDVGIQVDEEGHVIQLLGGHIR